MPKVRLFLFALCRECIISGAFSERARLSERDLEVLVLKGAS